MNRVPPAETIPSWSDNFFADTLDCIATVLVVVSKTDPNDSYEFLYAQMSLRWSLISSAFRHQRY